MLGLLQISVPVPEFISSAMDTCRPRAGDTVLDIVNG
jgi:hypothetical protein